MKITDLLDPRSISLDAAPTSKSETLDKAVELMAASGKLSDVEAFRKQVYAREEESTTSWTCLGNDVIWNCECPTLDERRREIKQRSALEKEAKIGFGEMAA